MSTKDQVNQAHFLLRYTLQSLGLILVVALLIRVFLISSYAMSGSSMLPNVWPGDFLIARKWHLHEPRRGDVVALRCPPLREKLCLKRVVAIPGDRVEFRDGGLVLNGQEGQHRVAGSFQTEIFAGGSWAIWPEAGTVAPTAPQVVPQGSIYVLNDKRGDHEDSRAWGAIPDDLIEGKVMKVWMSLDWMEADGRVRSWPRVRWARLFHSVD